MGFAPSTMQVTSPAFEQGGDIPRRHTGEGEDLSPALNWQGAPQGTRAFALICHDPDAPLVTEGRYGFVHWLLYNLPGSLSGLEEAAKEGTAGINDFGNQGYGGPMPPPGHGDHSYYFWVLALDRELELASGLSLNALLEAVEPHLLGMSRLVGRYARE